MDVDFSKLPKSILKQIPLSLRTYKTVYVLEELPVSIQYLIKDYLKTDLLVTYKTVFDITPEISKYSDLNSIDNIIELVSIYLKNYLMITPGTYPWDPWFGCRLKQQIQTKDTNLRQTFITSEINNIVAVIASELTVSITIESINIVPTSTGAKTDYSITIKLNINNTHHKQVNMTF